MNTLNRGQRKICEEAVQWFKYGSEQVFEIDGKAGTGKTHLMFRILQQLGLSVNQFLPMAYTGQASIVMRTRGFTTARSIHSSLYEVIETYDNSNISDRYGMPFKKKEFVLKKFIDPNIVLFFIDEGYMVPDSMVKDILSFGIKVIVCGDSNQLPPVAGNPGFLTGPGVHHLTELMRQALDNPIVYLAERARLGQPIHLGTYGTNAMVIEDCDFIPQMIGFADCVACGTNRTRDYMNSYIRQLAGYTNPMPSFGERVVCRNNNWQMVKDGIALANGLTGIIASQPDVSHYNGKAFTINFKPDLANTMFFDIPVNYEYFISPYDKRQELKENAKWMIGEMFEFAYASTTHLLQGSEYNNGIYIEEFMRPQMQNKLNYTACTRFKQNLIYIKKANKTFHFPDYNIKQK